MFGGNSHSCNLLISGWDSSLNPVPISVMIPAYCLLRGVLEQK